MKKILLLLFVLVISELSARDVYVKYRGSVNVDNGHFEKLSLH